MMENSPIKTDFRFFNCLLQLFYFGTYLPHRGSPASRHSARSNDWPYWLSLISCFHFGACHEEHQAFPNLAWWELPRAKARGLAQEAQAQPQLRLGRVKVAATERAIEQ